MADAADAPSLEQLQATISPRAAQLLQLRGLIPGSKVASLVQAGPSMRALWFPNWRCQIPHRAGVKPPSRGHLQQAAVGNPGEQVTASLLDVELDRGPVSDAGPRFKLPGREHWANYSMYLRGNIVVLPWEHIAATIDDALRDAPCVNPVGLEQAILAACIENCLY